MLLARTLALPCWVALNGRNFVEPILSMPDGANRRPVPCIDGASPLARRGDTSIFQDFPTTSRPCNSWVLTLTLAVEILCRGFPG